MSHQQLINMTDVLRHALEHQDPRLIHHGERVAYILLKILEDNHDYTPAEKQDIIMLGLYHDIGAYKKEEIDSMFSLEATESMEYSIFGYLLFKAFSPLPKYADCILYHNNYTAQYYSVPLSPKHRDIARLLHLADIVDISAATGGADFIASLLQRTSSHALFTEEDLNLFLESDCKHQILKHLTSNDYLQQLSEYIEHELLLTEEQIYAFLRMYMASIDFRSEYTILHTSYAIHLSESFAQILHLDESACKMIQLAAMLHNIGKTSVPFEIHTASDFLPYLKEFYQPSLREATNKILAGAVEEPLISTIIQSLHLLECLLSDQYNPPSFTPSPSAEIVALSYYVGNHMNNPSKNSRLEKRQLMDYLVRKYKTYGLKDSMLRTFMENYDLLLSETSTATDLVMNNYNQLMTEKHTLEMVFTHYSRKY